MMSDKCMYTLSHLEYQNATTLEDTQAVSTSPLSVKRQDLMLYLSNTASPRRKHFPDDGL